MASTLVLQQHSLPLPSQSNLGADYAHRLVLEKLADFYTTYNDKLVPDGKFTPDHLPDIDELEDIRVHKVPDHGVKVCIVGAGVAGLFTAMILDFLNKRCPGLNISYEIFEAAKKNRLGGRLYTHRFSEEPHDYYDVGAMRFPEIPIMKRTFDLFMEPERGLGMVKMDLGPKSMGNLIPYYLKGKNCPTLINYVHHTAASQESDPFKMNTYVAPGDQIPKDLMTLGPDAALQLKVRNFKRALRADPELGMDLLKDVDMSTREYLQSKDCNFNTVEWLETFASGTGWFDQALSETVIELMDFDYYDKDAQKDYPFESRAKDGKSGWRCIDGGTQQVATRMAEKIKVKPVFETSVIKVKLDRTQPDFEKMEVQTISGGNIETHRYTAVFNSTPLGCMGRMDLSEAYLNYGTVQAIRSLRYGSSAKVGMKFKTPWWITEKGIKGGAGKTDLSLRVCVYPSYNLEDDLTQPAVLLCSYSWAQDATRIGSLIKPTSPEHEEELKRILLRDLAYLHAKDSSQAEFERMHNIITASYMDHYAYNWTDDPNTCGAFAWFGPRQFERMYPNITAPQCDGKLFIIGEAASFHHAWIVGALESAIRGVYQFLNCYSPDNQPFKDAMEILKDEKNAPFGPLPGEVDPVTAQHQVWLARYRYLRDSGQLEKFQKEPGQASK